MIRICGPSPRRFDLLASAGGIDTPDNSTAKGSVCKPPNMIFVAAATSRPPDFCLVLCLLLSRVHPALTSTDV